MILICVYIIMSLVIITAGTKENNRKSARSDCRYIRLFGRRLVI